MSANNEYERKLMKNGILEPLSSILGQESTEKTAALGRGIKQYSSLADRPTAAEFGVGTCQIGGNIYISDGKYWASALYTEESIYPNLPSTIWRYPLSATAPYDNSYWVYVPIDANNNFAYFGFGVWNAVITPVAKHITKFGLAKKGTQVLNGACTKVGTWAASTPSGVAYALTQSSTAGNTISATVKGHTIVLRTATVANGGYGIVSIDGDYTKANRLPVFTASDYAAGLCRSTDVGKAYVLTGASGVYPDLSIVLADNLTDASHDVVLEVTGTKPASLGAGARLYVGAIVGCSLSDATLTADNSTVVFCHIEPITDNFYTGGSAIVYTPEVEKAVATGTYEFLGEVHGAETSELFAITVDGVDQSAMAANAYVSGSVINIDAKTTLASTDATGTAAIRKVLSYSFTSYGTNYQATVSWKATFLIDKKIRSSYVAMLPIAHGKTPTVGVINDRFNQVEFGNYVSSASDFTGNDNAVYGKTKALSAVAHSTLHNVQATVAVLDGGESVDYFNKSGPLHAFLNDRADGYDKIYLPRTSDKNYNAYYAGDVIKGVVGFKISVV